MMGYDRPDETSTEETKGQPKVNHGPICNIFFFLFGAGWRGNGIDSRLHSDSHVLSGVGAQSVTPAFFFFSLPPLNRLFFGHCSRQWAWSSATREENQTIRLQRHRAGGQRQGIAYLHQEVWGHLTCLFFFFLFFFSWAFLSLHTHVHTNTHTGVSGLSWLADSSGYRNVWREVSLVALQDERGMLEVWVRASEIEAVCFGLSVCVRV